MFHPALGFCDDSKLQGKNLGLEELTTKNPKERNPWRAGKSLAQNNIFFCFCCSKAMSTKCLSPFVNFWWGLVSFDCIGLRIHFIAISVGPSLNLVSSQLITTMPNVYLTDYCYFEVFGLTNYGFFITLPRRVYPWLNLLQWLKLQLTTSLRIELPLKGLKRLVDHYGDDKDEDKDNGVDGAIKLLSNSL